MDELGGGGVIVLARLHTSRQRMTVAAPGEDNAVDRADRKGSTAGRLEDTIQVGSTQVRRPQFPRADVRRKSVML
jgi:hypothetical protein